MKKGFNVMDAMEIVLSALTAIVEGRLEDALGYYADEVGQRSPDPHAVGLRVRRGKDVLRKTLEADLHSSTRAIFRYGPMIASQDRVAVEGTNCGFFNGVYVEQPVALFFEIKDARIQVVTIYYDRLAIRRILDPTPQSASPTD